MALKFTLYKPGQGYWTRLLSAIGGGTLVLAGMAWMWSQLEGIENEITRRTTQSIVVVSILLVAGIAGWLVLNHTRIVDFLIATEAEMRKVNWPTRREIIGSTWVVICGTVLMMTMLFVVDVIFAQFFRSIGILG